MKWYPWLRPHFNRLIDSYKIGRGHYALLVQALPGLGVDVLIYAIMRFLMCEHPNEYKSCSKCRGCQLMQAHTHPDYYSIKLETGKTSFGIDAVREISEKIYKHAYMGGAKVVWLQDAIHLTEASVNGLLKIIEEPPERTWFFFACYDPRRLLLTLRSRCRVYYLNPPHETLAVRWLKREVVAPPKAYLSALRQCGGAPIAALAQLQPKIWLQREQLCNILSEVLQNGAWITLLGMLNQEEVLQRLYWLTSLFLDAIKLQQGARLFSNPDVLPLLTSIANQLSGIDIQFILHELLKVRKQLLIVSWSNYELPLTNLLLRVAYFLKSGVSLSDSLYF